MSKRQSNDQRNVHGILLLDKPTGITSNRALQRVKQLFRARKAGHTGSLDPLASGLLPICLGEATKISGFLLDADKFYRVKIKLGEKTTTGDAEGQLVSEGNADHVSGDMVRDVLQKFVGKIQQIPPMYSAIKQGGQPLYKLARKGLEVERQPRSVEIYELVMTEKCEDIIDIDVACSKGTYIRTLAEDIGDVLGCGAHVVGLRRLKVGPFGGEEMITLDELMESEVSKDVVSIDRYLQPMENALVRWPDVRLQTNVAFFLRRGQAVLVPHAPTTGWVRIFEGQKRFIGVGQVLDDGRIAPKRLVNI